MYYLKNYYNNINKFLYLYILDTYTKYTYISISNKKFLNITNILILNKFIFKIINYNIVYIYKNFKKFIIFIKSFISKLYNIIISITNIYKIDIQILNIFYKVILLNNKLIIKINNFTNIIIYIPLINKIKYNIQYSNYVLISISSYNKEFITNLSSIIINSKKFNVYTNTGIKYLNQNIKLKKSLKLSKK
uniref:Ribosomal protein L6 n=1 Tax=Babesia gibsoni TaxID=33632 RepID=A0A6M8NYD5_BABGI|nr:ribosomal protein L6 [Babesia gibsoni]